MRRIFSKLSMITSCVEKIFIIIINKIRLVKPLIDAFSSYLNLNIFSSRDIQKIFSPTSNIIFSQKNPKFYQVNLDKSILNIPNENIVIEYEIKDSELYQPESIIMKHPLYENDYALFYSFNPLQMIKNKLAKEVLEYNFEEASNPLLSIDDNGV